MQEQLYVCQYCGRYVDSWGEWLHHMEIHKYKKPALIMVGLTCCIGYKRSIIMEAFNADEITLENFEGIFKCRKKPIIIHALQMNFPEGFEVTTMEGKLKGKQGDYLMFGVNGEKYPCDKEIFEKTYDII